MTKRQESQRSLRVDHATASQTKTWIERELVGSEFTDVRLNKRFRRVFQQLSEGAGESIPLLCQDWANTKAAYRFLSNHRVNEGAFLLDTSNPHTSDSLPRIPLFWSFTIRRNLTITERTSGRVGIQHRLPVRRRLNGRLKHYVVCGIQMHSSLAVTTDGLPLGLTATKFWTRRRFIGCNALKKKINPTRVPIEKKESIRWLENLQ